MVSGSVVRTRPHMQRMIWQDRVFHAVNLALVIVVLVVMLYPLYLVVICSVSDANLVSRGQVTLYPRGLTLDGYNAVIKNKEIWRSYVNSVLYTVSGTIISLAVTMGAAFTLSRKFPGKRLISTLFVFTMFFGGGLIPTFLTMRNVGLYNNVWVCILMGCVSVWNVMLARTYITSTIPEALYEASTLDGATQIQYFLRIVVPLCGTIIAVLSVYYGVDKWNDYWTGLIYINDRALLPLQTILKEILASLEMSREIIMSMRDNAESDAVLLQRAQIAKYCVIVVSTVPAVVLYLCMQKFFVKGVMVGSVKG
ncbi:MAG: carbohydrate ABC transporter permease [Oscillospiraceae bacterium]|nr:carbohydrate ABC transporter permease [Oscillospiraceae bacterium]